METIPQEVIHAISSNVLCWLATVNKNGQPSCSPKEAFCVHDNTLIIANISSPNSVQNISSNPNVCVSLIDIFTQKGFKIYGKASYTKSSNANEQSAPFTALRTLIGDTYPLLGVITIKLSEIKPIIAPSYFLNPKENEEEKKNKTYATYNVKAR